MSRSQGRDKRLDAARTGRRSWQAWLGVLILPFSAGCDTGTDVSQCAAGDCSETASQTSTQTSSQPPANVLTCDLHAFAGSPTGMCVPHVDAGWQSALVRKMPVSEGRPGCPQSAEWAGLFGQEIGPPDGVAQYVVGCSVNPLATCPDYSWACVPYEPAYQACVVQLEQGSCPGPGSGYTLKIIVDPEGGGAPTTVCCLESEGPG